MAPDVCGVTITFGRSQYGLARLLADLHNPPELEEARTWYTRAAEAGHSGARFKLGLLLAAQLAKPQLAETHTGSGLGQRGWARRRARS